MSHLFSIVLFAISWAAVTAWTAAHQLIIGWVVAVLIERLPPPDEKSSKTYMYIYGVLQFFAANSRRTQDALTLKKA